MARVVHHQVPDFNNGRFLRQLAGRQAARHGVQQLARVGVPRAFQDARGCAGFQHFAVLHDNHAFGVARHHRQVVADHQHRRVVFAGQVHHQFQHVALHHGVQRGGGLVGNQQRRLQQHYRGQHHALAHAAGKLVRPSVHRPFRVADAHAAQHFKNTLAALRGRHRAAMQFQAFVQLPADGHGRVQRRHGFLEHHADAGAAQLAQHCRLGLGDIHAFEQDGPARHHQRRGRQAHDGARGLRLAAARLAHDADHFARGNVKRHSADDLAAALPDGQRQVRYGYQCAHCTPLMRGSRRSRTASPNRLMPSSASAMARPGRMDR